MCEQKIAIQFGLPCLGRNACDQQTNKTTNKRKRSGKKREGRWGWGAVLFHCKHIFYVVMLTIYSFLLSRQPSLLKMRYSHAVLILHNHTPCRLLGPLHTATTPRSMREDVTLLAGYHQETILPSHFGGVQWCLLELTCPATPSTDVDVGCGARQSDSPVQRARLPEMSLR